MLPDRVPINRPSSGVNPIVVSIDLPWFTAVMEPPFPRWQVIKPRSRRDGRADWPLAGPRNGGRCRALRSGGWSTRRNSA